MDVKSLVRQRVPGRPDGTVVSELVDVMEFAVDRLGEGEWIETRPQITERLQGRPIDACSRQETIEGRLRGVVDTAEARTDAGLPAEFHRGLEEIHHQAQLVAVKIVDRRERGWRIVAVPAQELPDVRIVFLLDMRIVVLLIGPPRG